MSERRDFFKKVGLLGLTGMVSKMVSNERLQAIEEIGQYSQAPDAFTLPALPYAYNALEPFIDTQTMETHHSKHHAGYVKKLNELKPTDVNYSVDDISKCKQLEPLSKGMLRQAQQPLVFRNNLGGHVNHCLFWVLLKPNPKNEINLPTGKLAELIKKEFTSFEEFKKLFSEKAAKHFGSGWCWLVERNGKLAIETTENQENPFMRKDTMDTDKVKVLLALDVWEHAYYLKYQNKRADYITDWWNITNWEKANEFLSAK